jgi:monoamine oxidase
MKIIIIGAGAAGLMAGKILAAAGHHIQILEARDRYGGRIHSFLHDDKTFEGGAEFIHGNLQVTLDLLREAGIGYTEVGGAMIGHFDGQWQQTREPFEHADEVEDRLSSLRENISIKAFLEREFSGDKYAGLRHSLLGYIEGYYAAEPSRMSAQQFYKEWNAEDEQQYRVDGGYGRMINYLAQQVIARGGSIETSVIAKLVQWEEGKATVTDSTGKIYDGDKLIVTIPLGVWQQQQAISSISFNPTIPNKIEAAQQLGFGHVIKILMLFSPAFWDELKGINAAVQDMGFIFSDQPIPTYWSQIPSTARLLTGWLAGPKSTDKKWEDDSVVLQETLASLAAILNKSVAEIESLLEWNQVFNWNKDPFTLGGYTYSTMESEVAKKKMVDPLADTIFFAGEALYDGTETGTVEAALASGLFAAKQIKAVL